MTFEEVEELNGELIYIMSNNMSNILSFSGTLIDIITHKFPFQQARITYLRFTVKRKYVEKHKTYL
jgi:hypothetical protein